MNFSVQTHHRVKIKESEKRDKYIDLARELKELWNMKLTGRPIVIGWLWTITKGLIKTPEDLKIKKNIETIYTTVLLKSGKILRIVLETWGDLLSLNHLLKLVWKTLTIMMEYDGDTNWNWCDLNDPQRGLQVLEIRGWVKTIQTTALKKSARIMRPALDT